MTRQKQLVFQVPRPTVAHPLEILGSITRINFIAYDRKSVMRQMHSNLMHPSGLGKTTNQSISPPIDLEAMLDLESSQTCATCRMNHLPYPDRRRTQFTLAQDWLIANPFVRIGPTVYDRKVFLLHLAPFENDTKFTRGKRVLGHQDKPARIPIQTVDDCRLRTIFDLEGQQTLDPTKQGRLGLAVGRMHNQWRRLVDHKPVGRLVDHRKIHDNLQAHPPNSQHPRAAGNPSASLA